MEYIKAPCNHLWVVDEENGIFCSEIYLASFDKQSNYKLITIEESENLLKEIAEKMNIEE